MAGSDPRSRAAGRSGTRAGEPFADAAAGAPGQVRTGRPEFAAATSAAQSSSVTIAAGAMSPSSAATSATASRQLTAAGKAPALIRPSMAVTQPAWLRAMTGTMSPGPTPAAANAAADASMAVRRSA